MVPKLLTSKVPQDVKEIQFFGNQYQGWIGYSKLVGKRALKIKTAAKDGIICFVPIVSDEKGTYLIIEMLNGTVGFR